MQHRLLDNPHGRSTDREDTRRAATPPPEPAAPPTLPSAQLLDVQGKNIAPLQPGKGLGMWGWYRRSICMSSHVRGCRAGSHAYS